MRNCRPSDWDGFKCSNCGKSTAEEHRKNFKSEKKRRAIQKGFESPYHQEMYEIAIEGLNLTEEEKNLIKNVTKELNQYGYRA